jgi:hypothetical protein
VIKPRNPLVSMMRQHTKPGPMKDRRRKLEEKTLDELQEIICPHCGFRGVVAQVEWDWTKDDMSDFAGYCPKCKKDYWKE